MSNVYTVKYSANVGRGSGAWWGQCLTSGEGSCHSSLLQTGLILGGVQLLFYTT
jgi:hypothetical protein